MPDGFDIQAAKKSGYSDAEIKQYLSKFYDIDGATKAGYTLDEIAANVSFEEKPKQIGGGYGTLARMGEKAIGAMSAPWQTISKGAGQAQRGDVVSGAANISTGILSAPFLPLMGLEAGAREIPVIGKPLSNLMRAPVELAGHAWEAVAGKPTNPQQEAIGGLAQTVLPILGGSAASKAGRAVGEKMFQGEEAFRSARNQKQIAKAAKEIQEAAPPKRTELNRQEAFKRAAPYLAEQERIAPLDRKGNEGYMEQARDRTRDAMNKLWSEAVTPQIARLKNVGAVIDGKPIAELIRSDISAYIKNHEPMVAERIEGYAKTFERQIPIDEANSYIAELNAKTNRYQKSTPETKAMMESADPNIASKARAVEGIRNGVYNKLSQFGEKDVVEFRRDYGALKQLHDAFERNIIPSEMQGGGMLGRFSSPIGTAMVARSGVVGAAYHPAATAFGGLTGLAREVLFERGKKNPTIHRAFERLGKADIPKRTIAEPDVTVRGLLPQATTRLGSGGESKMTVTTGVPDMKKLFNQEGLMYLGEQNGFVWFNDPNTNSTLMMRPSEVTRENILRKVNESRRKFQQ